MKVDPNWWRYLFDGTYLLTDARSVCDPEITRREIDVIEGLGALQPEHQILDLCGGHGRHSAELCARGFRNCTVLDYSEYLIERGRAEAAARSHCIDFVRADARETGLPSESFDRVLVLGNSLGYLPEPEDDRRILAEAFRLLRPAGRVLVDVTNGATAEERFRPTSWHEVGDDVVVCRDREWDGDAVACREVVLSKSHGILRDCCYRIRMYAPSRLADLIGQAGFDSVVVHESFAPARREGDYGFMNWRMIATAGKPHTDG